MFDVSLWHEAHDYPLLRWVPSELKTLAIHSDPGTHLVRRRSSWELSWRSEALSILNLAIWIHWYIRFQSCLSRVRAVTILIWYWTQFCVAHLPYHIQMRILPNISALAVQHRVRLSAPKSLVMSHTEPVLVRCVQWSAKLYLNHWGSSSTGRSSEFRAKKSRKLFDKYNTRKASMENLPKVNNRRKEGLG